MSQKMVPYIIVNRSGHRKGIVVSSLAQLKVIAREKFSIEGDVNVYLENNRTEVESEDYFETRPADTSFLILQKNDSIDSIPELSEEGDRGSTLLPKYIKPKEFSVRRTIYNMWTNETNVRQTFRNTLCATEEFFKKYFLRLDPDESFGKDVVNVMKENSIGEIPDTLELPPSKNLKILINDHPLINTIYIENEILVGIRRSSSTSAINQLGCQHLYVHDRMLDTSTASASSSESILETNENSLQRKRKRAYTIKDPYFDELKTCQKAKFVECHNELSRHKKNSSVWDPKNCVQVDVLIFINQHKICQDLSQFLGLIFIEGCVEEANIKADIEEVLQLCTSNKESKVYRLIQAYINVKLLSGQNNICLTANYNLFINAKANSKSLVFKQSDYEYFSDLPNYASYIVDVGIEAKIFDYITAISKIVNKILCVKSDIKAIVCFSRKKEDENDTYHELDLPLSAVIPFHILKFFSQVLMKQIPELSYNNIKF